jgi:hypothetical protein
MRAYLGQIDRTGLRRFLFEDAIAPDSIGPLDRDWSSTTKTVIRAVVSDEDAEALHRELRAGDHGEACSLLLDRAVEVLAIGESAPRIPPADR